MIVEVTSTVLLMVVRGGVRELGFSAMRELDFSGLEVGLSGVDFGGGLLLLSLSLILVFSLTFVFSFTFVLVLVLLLLFSLLFPFSLALPFELPLEFPLILARALST